MGCFRDWSSIFIGGLPLNDAPDFLLPLCERVCFLRFLAYSTTLGVTMTALSGKVTGETYSSIDSVIYATYAFDSSCIYEGQIDVMVILADGTGES